MSDVKENTTDKVEEAENDGDNKTDDENVDGDGNYENEEDEDDEENEEDEDEDYISDDYDIMMDTTKLQGTQRESLSISNDSTTSSSSSSSSTAECQYLFTTLLKAHNLVQEQKIYGSSTVCLLSLRFDESSDDCDDCCFMAATDNSTKSRALLSTCNLGDSGYMIIRGGQCVFKSQSQSHRFNAPYQIGCTPPELLDHDLYRDR